MAARAGSAVVGGDETGLRAAVESVGGRPTAFSGRVAVADGNRARLDPDTGDLFVTAAQQRSLARLVDPRTATVAELTTIKHDLVDVLVAVDQPPTADGMVARADVRALVPGVAVVDDAVSGAYAELTVDDVAHRLALPPGRADELAGVDVRARGFEPFADAYLRRAVPDPHERRQALRRVAAAEPVHRAGALVAEVLDHSDLADLLEPGQLMTLRQDVTHQLLRDAEAADHDRGTGFASVPPAREAGEHAAVTAEAMIGNTRSLATLQATISSAVCDAAEEYAAAELSAAGDLRSGVRSADDVRSELGAAAQAYAAGRVQVLQGQTELESTRIAVAEAFGTQAAGQCRVAYERAVAAYDNPSAAVGRDVGDLRASVAQHHLDHVTRTTEQVVAESRTRIELAEQAVAAQGPVQLSELDPERLTSAGVARLTAAQELRERPQQPDWVASPALAEPVDYDAEQLHLTAEMLHARTVATAGVSPRVTITLPASAATAVAANDAPAVPTSGRLPGAKRAGVRPDVSR